MEGKVFSALTFVKADAMSRKEYNDYRGWELPADENGADEGFLIENLAIRPSNVEGREGYVSWVPKELFEKAYRPYGGMNLGIAIEAFKSGAKISRPGKALSWPISEEDALAEDWRVVSGDVAGLK